MKSLVITLLLALAACGGSDAPPPSAAAQAFIGTWTGTLTSTVTCPSQSPFVDTPLVALPIAAGSGADLAYTSSAGCSFKFQVSGSTASLANGPVTCTSSPGGTATTLTVTSYTLTTTDAHSMTTASAGTIAQSGLTCAFTLVGPMTKA
jgi:hypothetical protein